MGVIMILFITRKFPPSKGGMERVAYELSQHLSKITDVKLVKWGGSNKWLPLVLPYLLFRSSWILLTSKVSVVYLEDGLLAPLGLILKRFRKPVTITIHGRDIAFENKLYQVIVPKCLDRLDRVICVSHALKEECLKRGVADQRLVVIPNGISDEFKADQDKSAFKEELSRLTGKTLFGRKVLLSVGRLIEKKGIHWFADKVMPQLVETNCAYIIAGDGVLLHTIKKSIEDNQLENNVFMLGWANRDMLKILYNAADIFIMPNIPAEGDMEGFGLVAVEAASCALPVVTSNLEGIREAIQDGKNGFLTEPCNAQGYIDRLKELLGNDELRERFGAQARQYTLESYSWESRAQRYLDEFAKLEG
jgi:glycosyltransferase involved in cell wall biosynthesis